MKKRLALLLIVAVFCSCATVFTEGGIPLNFETLTREYKEGDVLKYTFSCKFPVLSEENPVYENINQYYVVAVREMTELFMPMYAKDPDMGKMPGNYIYQNYEITCNNGRFFSTRMLQEQKLNGEIWHTIGSQVFDVSGEYAGESLTLRGLLEEIGESSDQIAELVIKDIWQKIEQEIKSPSSHWKSDLSFEQLELDFFPQEHFYADEENRAVFYLQPYIFRTDGEIITYSYSKKDIEKLILEEGKNYENGRIG
ncbi:MAG: hypothetical protein Q4E07_06640 [Eubacteriales bacterium]|nr:hypothetical protein [Eubacteriales bacterium]